MKATRLTRRERQAEQLKKEILDAAVKVFKQYGYEKATTKKIAKEAEVSEGTLYYYFENKRAILITLFSSLIENIKNNLTRVSTGKEDITELLSKGMAQQYKQISILPILTLFIHESKLDPEVREIFAELMAAVREYAEGLFNELIKNGKIRKINSETMALLMSLIGIGYMTLFESGDKEINKIPLQKLTDDFAHILVGGLRPEK